MAHLEAELEKVGAEVRGRLMSSDYAQRLRPSHLQDAIYSYLLTGGKFLRSAMLVWSCGALGGSEEGVIAAAAAVELYHTWTLVHDDIIDRDLRRRGGPSVHEEFRRRGRKELGLSPAAGRHYGLSMAVLAGDVQHAWAIDLMGQVARQTSGGGSSTELALRFVRELEGPVLRAIAEGEALDLQYSLLPPDEVSESQVLSMISLKTGALYEFSARAGAALALGRWDDEDPRSAPLGAFGRNAGIAFQLQDDILGLVGQVEQLGKPVGSDLREGKRTTIVVHAWQKATDAEREELARVLGNPRAGAAATARAVEILVSRGGIEHTRALARTYVERALRHLNGAPESDRRELLQDLARAMVEREK